MEYLGLGALLFFIIFVPLLLAVVIVSAIVGKVLGRSSESWPKGEETQSPRRIEPGFSNFELQHSLEQFNNRLLIVEQSVSLLEKRYSETSELLIKNSERAKLEASWLDLIQSTMAAQALGTSVTYKPDPKWDRDFLAKLSAHDVYSNTLKDRSYSTKKNARLLDDARMAV